MRKATAFILIFLALASACGTPRPFSSEGQVINVNSGASEMIHILCATNRISILNATGNKRLCSCGDVIKVYGCQDPSAGAYVFATNIIVTGRSPFPSARPITPNELRESQLIGSCVSARGVLTSVLHDELDAQWNWLILSSEGQTFFAAATECEYPLTHLRELLDAEVVVCGVVDDFVEWRRFLGNRISLFGENGIRVTKTPQDPFVAPKLGSTDTPHRQTATGTVLGIGPDRIFLKTQDGEFLLVATMQGTPRPPCGARATVSGFASRGHNSRQLTEAVLRIENAEISTPEIAYRIRPDELFPTLFGKDIANFQFIGKTIRITGRVRDVFPTGKHDRRLKIDFGGHHVFVDLTLIDDLAHLEPNCVIDVSGVCYADFTSSPSLAFPQFGGFTLYPRGPDDLLVVSAAPWWTPARLLVVIIALLVILSGILLWNRLLNARAEKKGRELAREQLRFAKSELKVEERTRLAVEIHDSISQTLTGVAFQIETALDPAIGPDKHKRLLEIARSMLASCRQELRFCLWDLRSRTFVEKDMNEAILRTVAPHMSEAKVAVRFNVRRDLISEPTAHAILRIVRELVVNAIRHGKASRILIAGEYREKQIRFSVRDNGKGFDVAASPGPGEGHFGLQGILERVNAMNGTVKIDSTPGKGARITISLPEERE